MGLGTTKIHGSAALSEFSVITRTIVKGGREKREREKRRRRKEGKKRNREEGKRKEE